ncbi:MAG: response regulator transcription factor [Deltaproteobacteria bacterium]|nr:response regulator transcription factor [Deltaproteobacteria bacterium]
MKRIKVFPAFSNMLFSEGICKLMEGSDDIEIIRLKTGIDPLKTVEAERPDIILVDFTTLYNIFSDICPAHNMKFMLIDTCCGEDNIISAVITKGLKGVLIGNTTPLLLKKAIRTVADGEIWLDKVNVKNLLTGLHALKNNNRAPLSEREWEVVSLVGQGFRNKEIAEKLCISEPTVKTHLQRIFQKLDIQNRPQLITYAIKNQGEGSRGTEFF